jgi:hypothetical protein
MKSPHGLLALSLLLVASGTANAQYHKPTPIHTVSQALDFWITNTQDRVVSAADAMPAERYSFAPTAGEFTGVRTFSQQIKHLAANNYRMAAYILKQTPTPDQESESGPDAVQSKAQITDSSRAHSQRCIGRWLRSARETCWSRWQRPPVPGRIRVFSSPWTRWPTPTITTGRWWNICV